MHNIDNIKISVLGGITIVSFWIEKRNVYQKIDILAFFLTLGVLALNIFSTQELSWEVYEILVYALLNPNLCSPNVPKIKNMISPEYSWPEFFCPEKPDPRILFAQKLWSPTLSPSKAIKPEFFLMFCVYSRACNGRSTLKIYQNSKLW
jgi:hypothetical protein